MKKCKTLMHCGIHIDDALLNSGLYLSAIPRLYPMTTTIESMVESAEKVRQMLHLSDKYFENLKQCELVEVSILTDEQLMGVVNIGREVEVTKEAVHGFGSYWKYRTVEELIEIFNSKE